MQEALLDRQQALSEKAFFSRELTIDFSFHRETGKIAAILGSRRAGKSTYLLQIQKQLELEKKQGIWIDFTEYLWQDFQREDWKTLWEVSLEICGNGEPVFFLDEIQQLDDFESGLRYLQNQGVLIFITGSNSAVFGRRMAESLRGKVLSYHLFPLSFSEFLLFRSWKHSPPYNSRQRAELNNLLEEYLQWGGFPEVVLAQELDLKRHLIHSYVDTMLLRDVVDRHDIKNVDLVERLFQKCLLSFTKPYSVHRWFNDFKSQGRRLSKDTLYEYLHHLEESLFLMTIKNRANPGAARKIYLVDNGLYQSIRSKPDKGQLWENACFLDLLRRGKKPDYWLDEKGEIDFVTEEELIQVCYSLHDENVKREKASLLRMQKERRDKSLVIWTRNPLKEVTLEKPLTHWQGL